MKKPHKHAECIKAWADGAQIEFYDQRFSEHRWKLCGDSPVWDEMVQYRIKPEPKPDVVTLDSVQLEGDEAFFTLEEPNLKLTWCGETGKLKSAEVL